MVFFAHYFYYLAEVYKQRDRAGCLLESLKIENSLQYLDVGIKFLPKKQKKVANVALNVIIYKIVRPFLKKSCNQCSHSCSQNFVWLGRPIMILNMEVKFLDITNFFFVRK